MNNKEKLLTAPIIAVFMLTVIDTDYSNLRVMDYVILSLIALNLVLMSTHYFIRRKKHDV